MYQRKMWNGSRTDSICRMNSGKYDNTWHYPESNKTSPKPSSTKSLRVCDRQAKKKLCDRMEITRGQRMKAPLPPPSPHTHPKSDKKPHQRSQQANDERAGWSNRRNESRHRRKYSPKFQENEIEDLRNTGTETIHVRNRKFHPRSSHTK